MKRARVKHFNDNTAVVAENRTSNILLMFSSIPEKWHSQANSHNVTKSWRQLLYSGILRFRVNFAFRDYFIKK